MATGDQDDMIARLKATIPPTWFPPSSPILEALLSGFASAASWIYGLIQYARLQTRISTATDGWLDLISWDFFATRLPRRSGEPDPTFATRIKAEILRPRQTRSAILQMLLDLTGNAATIQEGWNPQDWGGYGLPYSGYGIGIGYGSLQLRNQVFITAVRPSGSGIPNVSGYGIVSSGYGAPMGNGEYADLSQITGAVTDAEIYARITQTIAAGTTAWVDIASPGTQGNGALVIIGQQTLAMEAVTGFFW